MSRRNRRKNKPKSPQQIAAERAARLAAQRAGEFGAVGLAPEQSTLSAYADVEAEFATQDNVKRARRVDAFAALKEGMEKDLPGAYDCARRLERDMIIRRGEHDRGRAPDRVDEEHERDRLDKMIDAGRRVDTILAHVGKRDAWLLTELVYPSPSTIAAIEASADPGEAAVREYRDEVKARGSSLDYSGHQAVEDELRTEHRGTPARPAWRSIVAYITGETTPHGQAAAVRSACANLKAAYEATQKGKTRRTAA